MASPQSLLLTERDIALLVQRVGLHAIMDRVIAQTGRAFLEMQAGRVQVSPRQGFMFPAPHTGVLEWMPATQVGDAVILKAVSYSPHNPRQRGLPTILSTLTLYDVPSGHLVALADGTFLTAVRTGAASALASRLFAHPESRVLGLVGCGAQAVTQAHALSRYFDLERILIYDIDPAAVASFPRRVAFLELPVAALPLAELEAEADILCTATSVPVHAPPVITAQHLKPHVHINAVGADLPGKTELPLDFLRASYVCPDYLPQALVEGECQRLAPEEIGAELGTVLLNPAAFAAHQNRPTVFDSTGFALEDLAALQVLLAYAEDCGI
ncbi:MAG: ornithine cyclodeaminase family protein, partial [Anaerolineae bacterium]|nr:ornithine cyclodeaminase family protein [Anaerolineae bacterium]